MKYTNNQPMPTINIVGIRDSEWRQLQSDITEIKEALKTPSMTIYDNSDLIKLLKVSERTLSTWREKGTIKYTKIGGKIFYTSDDVMGCIRDNRVGQLD